MMIGTTAEETASMVSSEDLRAMYDNDEAIALKVIKASSFLAGDLSLDRVTAVVKEYRRLMPELDGVGLMVRIATDTGFWRGAVQQAERNVNAGSAPVYTYELDWPIPILGRPWAAHGVDISLMFGNPAYGSNVLAEGDNDLERRLLYSASEEAALAQKMMKAWAAFAHKGNPSTADAEWPAYNLQNRPTMVFGRNSRVVNDVRGSIRPLVMHLPGI
jgi:para-nitrobenzyl esterase